MTEQQQNQRYTGLPAAADDVSAMSQSDYGEALLPSAGPSGTNGASTSQTALAGVQTPSNGTLTPKRPVKLKPLRKILDNALNQLQRRDVYLFFAQPVKKSEVPDYYDHIKEPMDLGTMQTKLESGQYKTLDQFRQDFLLVTRNAQYYNVIDGPSAIVNTEAKKLEDWGLKFLAREEPAVEEAAPKPAPSKPTTPAAVASGSDSPAPAKKAGRISIKLKKQPTTSMQSSASATPRLATPSRLQNEVKMEVDDEERSSRASPSKGGAHDGLDSDDEDTRRKGDRPQIDADDDDSDEEDEDDEDEDSEEDEDEESSDEDDEDEESSTRGASMSLDGVSAADAPKRRRRWRSAANKKKQQQRQSVIAAIVTRPAKDKKSKPEVAHISSASEIIAAQIPRSYRTDGAVDLSKLLDDEKATLLRIAGIDASSDVLAPFVDALMPIHPDLLTNASTHLRELRDIVDGFGAVLKEESFEQDETHTYDIPKDKAPDQQKYPYTLSAGWSFRHTATSVPLAWPRLMPTPGVNQPSEPQPQHGGGPLRRKDRDNKGEKEEVGLLNLDDWTYPRPIQSRLAEARDMGVYPGLLPEAWVHHIAYQKGGPAQSRLPPLYLAVGPAFENAILDELASLPNRVLLGGRPGIMSNTNAFPAPSPLDVATAIELASDRDWDLTAEEAKKAGVRGCDVLREAVYGGALGEAYAASVDDFVRGATISAEDTYEAEQVARATIKVEEAKASQAKASAPAEPEHKGPQSYFDENGEMYNVDAYIGVDLIPLDVRKEAGMVAQTGVGSNLPTERATPAPAQTPPVEEQVSYKRMRTTSRYIPNKRRLTENLEMNLRSETATSATETPAEADTPADTTEEDAEAAQKAAEEKAEEEEKERKRKYRFEPDNETSAFLRGSILDRSLYDHVKCSLIDPLSGGLLQLLDLVWEGIASSKEGEDNAEPFGLDLSILDEVANLVKAASVKSEDGTSLVLDEEKAPRLPFVPPPEFKAQLIGLVQRLHRREYYKAKSKLLELSRAQHSSIQLDGLVRGREDLLRPEVEKADASHAAALLFDNMCAPFDTQRAHTMLSEAAVEAVALSDALNAAKAENVGTVTHQERLDKLRIAYVTLAHHIPQRDMRKGHWSARLEAMRKDDMRAHQSGTRSASRPLPPSARPSMSHGVGSANGSNFPMASPSTPGGGSGTPVAPSPLDKISHVNSARLDISKLGAHPSLLASLAAMSSKKSPQPQEQKADSKPQEQAQPSAAPGNGAAESSAATPSSAPQVEPVDQAPNVSQLADSASSTVKTEIPEGLAQPQQVDVEMKDESANASGAAPPSATDAAQTGP